MTLLRTASFKSNASISTMPLYQHNQDFLDDILGYLMGYLMPEHLPLEVDR